MVWGGEGEGKPSGYHWRDPKVTGGNKTCHMCEYQDVPELISKKSAFLLFYSVLAAGRIICRVRTPHPVNLKRASEDFVFFTFSMTLGPKRANLIGLSSQKISRLWRLSSE